MALIFKKTKTILLPRKSKIILNLRGRMAFEWEKELLEKNQPSAGESPGAVIPAVRLLGHLDDLLSTDDDELEHVVAVRTPDRPRGRVR
ncbi:MAG TPA: hypothetical protein DEB09_00505 [Candidatus Magasanikbacteria bacterium]|nr:hypothetical protein [Candidatus Magasanikbacteria bacterium]